MRSESLMGAAATAAAGVLAGAAAVYVATQDHRQVRRTVHKLSRSAEKTLTDLDRAIERYTR